MQNRIVIRDAMLPPGESTAHRLRDLGVDAIEIQLDAALQPINLHHVDSWRAQGVRISAFLLMTDFADDPIDWVTDATILAADVGARVVRVDPLTARKDLTATEIADNCIQHIREILNRTADSAVRIGLENHAHFANDEWFLDRVLDAIPDSRFGLTLDTGNFYWFGYPLDDIYRLIDKYAQRTVYTHIKSINYPADVRQLRREIGYEYKQHCCGLASGDLDLRRIISIFKSYHYTGDFCIENESLFKLDGAQKMPALQSDVMTLRDAMR
jgi:sugar phosphate isomerase/epimerase